MGCRPKLEFDFNCTRSQGENTEQVLHKYGKITPHSGIDEELSLQSVCIFGEVT
jgi:hypothetical protein